MRSQMKNPVLKKPLGFFPAFNQKVGFEHSIGGSQKFQNGRCPNCKKPLMLHLTLDTRDERLGLHPQKVDSVSFLYCMRCPLSWYDFQYQIIDERSIRILRSYTDEIGELEEWETDVGIKQIKFMPIALIPVKPSDLAEKATVNHIGGQPYYFQRLKDPECPGCGEPMTFRISLTNDYREEAVFTFTCVQIAFFYCKACAIVHAQHST
jgi:hypothetical protein